LTFRYCDETEFGFGWIVEERIGRTSHALAADGGVWVVDPVDVPGVEERIRALGEPRGVVQLLDRHERDCAALAARLGVPLHEVPFDGVPGSPFDVLRVVRLPFWREAALWWPEARVLVCADAVGTVPYFRAPGEAAGVHALLRLTPPRRLGSLDPLHVLCGHGEGLHGNDTPAALRRALRRSRRDLPRALLAAMRSFRT
jgi:hypothetical protein